MDTRKNKDLTGTLIADIVFQLLSYVAQTEREFIRQRQKEGIAAAKARGVKFGRAPIPKPNHYEEVHALWCDGSVSGREAARHLKISQFSFCNCPQIKKVVKTLLPTLYSWSISSRISTFRQFVGKLKIQISVKIM